jgi:ABC-type transport system involved in multi-copper enzyme maturation permease subunit
MLRTLERACRVELLRRIRQGSLYAVVAGLAILVCFSVQVGISELEVRREDYLAQLSDLAREQVRPRLPLVGWVPEPVLRAIRRPELGSIVARGDDMAIPAYFDFGPAGVVWARNVSSDVAQLNTGTLTDVESIVRVLGGFLALVLGFQCIAGARALGTLKTWHALGAGAVPTVLGKLLGCWCITTAGSVVVLAAAALSAILRLPNEPTELSRIFIRCAVPTTLYLGCFVAIGGAFAIWARNQAGALAGGIALWILVAMVWPQAVALGAQMETQGVMRARMELQRDKAFDDEVRAGQDSLGNKVAEWLGDPTAAQAQAIVQERQRELDALWQTYVNSARMAAGAIEEAWRQEHVREKRFERLAYLSPGTPLLRSFAALSETGFELAGRWSSAVDTQEGKLVQLLFDNRSQVTVRVPSRGGRQLLRMERNKGIPWHDLPEFQTPMGTTTETWQAAARPLLALAAFLGLAVVVVAIGAPRLVT